MLSILLMLLFNYIIFIIVSVLVPNYYLAMMITSLIISFMYPCYSYIRMKRKILSVEFLNNFLYNAIFLLLGDLLLFMILG